MSLAAPRRLERGRDVSDSLTMHSSASVGSQHQRLFVSGRALHCLGQSIGTTSKWLLLRWNRTTRTDHRSQLQRLAHRAARFPALGHRASLPADCTGAIASAGLSTFERLFQRDNLERCAHTDGSSTLPDLASRLIFPPSFPPSLTFSTDAASDAENTYLSWVVVRSASRSPHTSHSLLHRYPHDQRGFRSWRVCKRLAPVGIG
jgi:hypothetical protein